jgi:hypothetical protein
MGLKETISELKTKEISIKAGIIQKILAFPDNPDITRVQGQPKCFTISMSTLRRDGNLNTIFYDFKHQHQKIIEKISQTEITNLDKMLDEIIMKGFFFICKEKIMVHPKVIEKLKELL